MNLKIQNYSNYNSINHNVINHPCVNFGSGYNIRPVKNIKVQDAPAPRVRLKLADLLTKLSLAVFRLAEKIAKKAKIDTQNAKFESEKLIRTLTKNLNEANGTIEMLTNIISSADTKISNLDTEIQGLNGQIDSANSTISDLQTEIEQANNNLEKVIQAAEKGEVNPLKKAKIYEEITTSVLNYDPMTPYLKTAEPMYPPEKYTDNYEDIKTGTTNRADMIPLEIPQIGLTGSFNFELPKGEMKVKKVKLKEFKEPFEIQSNISDKYNNSLVWNTDKIVRDLLQNFFDGHGQTLDGVKFIFTPAGIGKYKVRIEGKSTYNFKEAVLLGESSSHENVKAAGNYGEGLKMVTLKLLMGNKASNVKIGAGNWEVTCGLKKDERLDSELMNYKIEPVKEFDGNFIEFETSDKKLLSTIRESINRFYHSSNPHFKEPDFENNLFGFKILPKGEKGGLYIAGQQFEYEGSYNNIENGAIFIKEKIPTEYYDTSRDRVSISSSNFSVYITRWLESRTKNREERKQIIKCLEPFIYKKCAMKDILDRFVDELGSAIKYRNHGAIRFHDKYLAQDVLFLDDNVADSLISNGYKLFPSNYEKLGMKSVSSILAQAKQHEVFEPTETERQKILIIKKALNTLSGLKTYFNNDELDTKIYIFDANSKKENSIDKYKYTRAEAIIEKESCKGFYIDKNYLDKASFAKILETTLHELSHKAGGDGTEDFGYQLTNVNEAVLAQIFANPKIAEELRILNDIWNEL